MSPHLVLLFLWPTELLVVIICIRFLWKTPFHIRIQEERDVVSGSPAELFNWCAVTCSIHLLHPYLCAGEAHFWVCKVLMKHPLPSCVSLDISVKYRKAVFAGFSRTQAWFHAWTEGAMPSQTLLLHHQTDWLESLNEKVIWIGIISCFQLHSVAALSQLKWQPSLSKQSYR